MRRWDRLEGLAHVEQLAAGSEGDPMSAAAVALGWSGVLVQDVRLFDTRVAMVVDVDVDAHTARWSQADGGLPMLDGDVLAMWEWPEGREVFPSCVVSLTGVLVPVGRSWRQALTVARHWRGFAATAIVTAPGGDGVGEECLLECAYSGVAVASSQMDRESVAVVQPGRPARMATARRGTLDRWVEEKLYERLLADGVLT